MFFHFYGDVFSFLRYTRNEEPSLSPELSNWIALVRELALHNGSKSIYGARSLCLEGRNRMFPAIEVSMMPRLVSIRNWDFELVPKTTFPIPTRRPKSRFRTKNRNVYISSLKLLCYMKFRSNSSQKSFLAVKFLFFYPTYGNEEPTLSPELSNWIALIQARFENHLEPVTKLVAYPVQTKPPTPLVTTATCSTADTAPASSSSSTPAMPARQLSPKQRKIDRFVPPRLEFNYT